MAKSLLADYRIGGDIIDRLTPTELLEPSNSTDLSVESPPVGPEAADEPEDTVELQTDFTSELRYERDGLFHVFTLGSMIYRLGGVKPLFVTNLRVNIRVSFCAVSGGAAGGADTGTQSYYDSLDLYTARARTGFALAVSRSLGAEPSRVERDLVLILEQLEAERDERLRSGSKPATVSMSQADKEQALQFLRDPQLFTRVIDDLSALGYVGEDLNKILLYLCASSRKLDDPISVLILSQSASGKSFLVDTVKRLMPPEDVVAVTSLSDQALNYIDDLSHKFLVLGEAVHGEVIEHQIREMLSGKELSRLVTVKDAETGAMQSRVVRTPVIVASVMSGTNHAVNPENASRCFLINTDESREQTERIHAWQRGKYSLERLKYGGVERERIVRTHQAAQRLLSKHQIVNDFAPLLAFPSTLMRTRRDHDRFLDLIACVCFVRQFQKPEEQAGGLSFIRCDLEDYRVAYRVMVEGVMSSTMRELPKGAIGLYEQIRAWATKEAMRRQVATTELSFTQRQVRELSGLSHTWVKYAMRQLVEYEYVSLAKGGGERSKAYYRVREDEAIAGVDLSMIPTPEAMATLAAGRASVRPKG